MRIDCLHGFFLFSEVSSGQLSKFQSLYGFTLSPMQNSFTFDYLKNAPEYSIAGNAYLGATATATLEGDPWEVFEANDLVYDFGQGQVVSINTVQQRVKVWLASNYFLSDGLILPGSLTDDGLRVTDYSAWYSFDRSEFRYSRLSYG